MPCSLGCIRFQRTHRRDSSTFIPVFPFISRFVRTKLGKKTKTKPEKNLYNNKTSLILSIGIQMSIKVPHFASKSLV